MELILLPQNKAENDAENIILKLQQAIKKLEDCLDFGKLVPEVGSNMVYARQNARKIEDVAGLTDAL